MVRGTGAATQKNSYDAYGTPASTNQGRFQYTGQMWIPELGLYHYKARVYSPTLGRFLQTDPVGYADGMNLYAYVGNDPINRVDPLGLQGTIYVNGKPFDEIPFWKDDVEDWLRWNQPLHDGFGGHGHAQEGAPEETGPQNEIVVTGKRFRRVAVFPNSDGDFKCGFVGGRNVYVNFANNGVVDRVDASLTSYPSYDNGNAIP